MTGNQKFPSDLLLVAGLVILTDIFVLIPAFSGSFIRIVFGLPFVIFLPGYALIAMLFPDKTGLEGMERVALSIGMSVAVVPLIGLALNFTPWGIKEIPLLVSLSLFILLMSAIAYFRRKQLPEDGVFEVPLKKSVLSLLSGFLEKPESKTEGNFRLLLVLSFLILIGIVAYISLMPQEKEPFTKFYMLGPERMANNYKTDYIKGESGTYIIGIVNKEHRTVDYTMEAKLENQSLPLPENMQHIRLADNTTFEEPLEISPSVEGNNMKLQFLLFKDSEKNVPYRDLRLWINVTQEV
ncbi:MAG TPA: DUF1616 domain-containing protein [Methanosarcina sp.]|nr:DUF1616 domain-containing protein [Methanosarcina sp.]